MLKIILGAKCKLRLSESRWVEQQLESQLREGFCAGNNLHKKTWIEKE